MQLVLIFDADNTLWDTDSVFRKAQMAMLETLARARLLKDPGSHLEMLRHIDQELVQRLGTAEYNFQILATALYFVFKEALTPEQAVRKAITHAHGTEVDAVVQEAYQVFTERLKAIPCLFPDTEGTLSSIRTSVLPNDSVIMIILSEGEPQRLERVLQAHNMRRVGLFDEIIIAQKSRATFELAKQTAYSHHYIAPSGTQPIVILVGDSLHRDIKLGNQTGMITVYKPSAYKGYETPRSADEHPCYTINRLSELPLILKDIVLQGGRNT